MSAKKTRVVTAHVPEDLVKRVEKYAENQERSKGWVVRQALEAWVSQEEEWERMTLEGIADVDAGRVIAHEGVARWLESLKTDDPLPMPKPKNAG